MMDPNRVLRELPASEQPLNRLLRVGLHALSTAELLQIVLGATDLTAFQLLSEFQTLSNLARANLSELQSVLGIGQVRAVRLQAVFELARRLASETPTERIQIRSPMDAANLLMAEMSALEQEQMRVVLLNTKNRVVGTVMVYQGSVHTTVIRVGELFRDAIRRNCSGIVVAHNHPSQDPSPSPEDVSLTREIVKAGQLLDISVLDHLVIGSASHWVSLKEKGLGF
jgi:DNA repair protein RadC